MKRAYGFTIVELLIVIVVIAILAALSYVGYTNISNRAYNSAVQQDMRSLAQLVELYKAENGTYPAQLVASTLRPYGMLKVARDSYDATGIHGSGGGGGAYSGQYNLMYCSETGSLDHFGLIAKSRSGDVFQLRDGIMEDFTGAVPANSESLCANVVSSPSTPHRTWLYSAGSWVSWL